MNNAVRVVSDYTYDAWGKVTNSGNLNKGILYGTTSVGSFIYPGPGTVVGFVVGGVACVIVDIFVSDYLDDLIDRVVE